MRNTAAVTYDVTVYKPHCFMAIKYRIHEFLIYLDNKAAFGFREIRKMFEMCFWWHNYYPMILLPKYIYSGRNKSVPLDIICCNSRLALMVFKCYAIYAMCVTEIVPLALWVNVSEKLTSQHAIVGPTRTLTQAPGCFIVSGCVWVRVYMYASVYVSAC